jgi:hypothetical protein
VIVERKRKDANRRRLRGRPRHNKFMETDAWLIALANQQFQSGKAASAWAAIATVVKEAWSSWDDGTPGGKLMQKVLVGDTVVHARPGSLLSRRDVLGQSVNAVEQRVLARLRPNKRFPLSLQRKGKKITFRLRDFYEDLPIYQALRPRKSSSRSIRPQIEPRGYSRSGARRT